MILGNYLSENIFLRLSDVLTGYSIYPKLNFLNKSQFWTRDRMDDYQNKKLRELILHATTYVPFYKELFHDFRLKPEDIQTKEDLRKLPILTKEDLKRNRNKNLAENLNRKKLILNSSSGSTGEPFQYYSTKEAESMAKAMAIRGWNWMGYRLGDKYVKISMNSRGPIQKKIQDLVNNSVYLHSNQLKEENFQRMGKSILKNNPKFIRCYPVPLLYLARHLKKSEEIKCDNLIAINTTGSTLEENVRKEIEGVFNVKIFDSYSCEGGAIFAECPVHKYYHPAEEYAISEFVEDSVTKSDPAKPLRHITTDLFNYASPFIRYDTQDYVILGESQSCSCGRQFLNVKKFKGRDGDILMTPSGKILLTENFVAYFEFIPEVNQIQVVQVKPEEINFNLVVNDTFTSDLEDRITHYWQKYIGKDVNVLVNVVEEIKLTPSGKRRIVIRNPEIKLTS